MKNPGELQVELATELTKINEAADKITAVLSQVAAQVQDVPGQVKEIVETAAAWDHDVRAHGERITVKDPKGGTVVDLSRDMLYVALGGGGIESGALFINEAHNLPGVCDFRPATELEVRHVKERFGSGRVEAVMTAAEQIGR